MENRYALYSQRSSIWTSLMNEEFQEADIWGVSDSDRSISSYEQPCFISRRLPTATEMIPIPKRTSRSEETRVVEQFSAPVSIPDWTKIHGKQNSSRNDGGFARSSWESDEDDDDGNVVPPHEWLARKLARSQISSFSVCEGAGRTLKGRDLSRVRNAVLTKTGFLEPESNH